MARPAGDRSPAPPLTGQAGGQAGGAGLLSLRTLLQGPVKTKEPASCLLKEKERKARPEQEDDEEEEEEGSPRARAGGPGTLLGSLLWERALPFGEVEYVDLDAFLLEHGLPPSPPGPGPPAPAAPSPPAPGPGSCGSSARSSPGEGMMEAGAGTPARRGAGGGHAVPAPRDTPSPVDPEAVEVLMTFDPDPADLALSSVPGHETFDPRRHRFSEEELKPQPIMKKARKIQVPDEQKDEKYWSRRYKNNEAAKRSRDARRLKENQISVRAAFLEKENALLRQEVVSIRQELSHYRSVLSRYQAQHGAL
ncbi:D site-binding protein [Tachyglossus aculeatus]|uniref:D site-binding protein n=1 Tax=Tachyglossus aculeatus TaxID=9261 RepID=UPI0018F5DA56|nr:D site-binding protein [Tachyglossus aculeatus]